MAVSSLLGDSLTFDELLHLTAGMSHLTTGDFRLVPETPPLVQMWAALPLLFTNQVWPGAAAPGWQTSDCWSVGRNWLFDRNDGERLLTVARCMMVVLLLATCLAVYVVTRYLLGGRASALALVLAAMDTTLLAHGRLVTTDMAAALGFLLVVFLFARLLDRPSIPRVAAVVLAVSALSLVKFSWPLVLPSLFIMSAMAVIRPVHSTRPSGAVRRRFGGILSPPPLVLLQRSHRIAVLVGTGLLASVGVGAGIWTAYGWRYSPFCKADQGRGILQALPRPGSPSPLTMPDVWSTVLGDREQDGGGLTNGLIRFARDHHLLPEAYLYGAAFAREFANTRPSYLCGAVFQPGSCAYFPVAFAIKTPIALMLLALAGAGTILRSRELRTRAPVLLVGLFTLLIVYSVAAVLSRFNIGHRHLLPLYPILIVLAGASAQLLSSRLGRSLVTGAVVWLLAADLQIHPHYLCYFNELVGGPANGHRYLVDSNIDWGQDLKRLAAFAKEHPEEEIKLAYFGSADPTRYGFKCRALPSFLPFGQPAELRPGIYVVSASQLVGVYYPPARTDFWDANHRLGYRSLSEALVEPLSGASTPEVERRRRVGQEAYESMRGGKLLAGLCRRSPDLRIGYSLFVFRLTTSDLQELLEP